MDLALLKVLIISKISVSRANVVLFNWLRVTNLMTSCQQPTETYSITCIEGLNVKVIATKAILVLELGPKEVGFERLKAQNPSG